MNNAKRWKIVCILCDTSDSTISYFNFPADYERRSEWLLLCNITWDIPKKAKLCAKHFSPESFTKNLNDLKHRRRLRVDAVPSQCLDPLINDEEIFNNEESSMPVLPFQYKWCFVCGSVKDSQRSYHRFPKKVDDQNVWFSKCGRRQSSSQNMNNLRLCNLHFSSDSFIVNPRTKMKYLKHGAVPIDVKEFISNCQNNMNDDPEVVRTEETMIFDVREVGSTSQNNLNDDCEVERAEDAMTSMSLPTDTLNPMTETSMEIEIGVEESPSNSNSSLKNNRSSMQIQTQSTSDNLETCTLDKACQTEDDLLTSVPINVYAEYNTQPSVVVTPTTPNNHADVVQDHSYIPTGASKSVRKPRYVGDISTLHLATPNRATKCLEMTKKVIESKNKTIASLARKLRYAQEKLKTMKDLIIHLRDTKYISETASNELLTTTPDALKVILLRKQEGKRKKFSPELRRFALQLQFYSTKAYLFVRKAFGNLLPGPSTLRNYCCTVNLQPGISREVLQTLQNRAKNNGKSIICNLVIDEMALKEQTSRKRNRRYGYVNLGVPLDDKFNRDEDLTRANHALVFLLVGLNDSFKVPVAYFLIRHLSAAERANLVRHTLRRLHEHNINVHSVTYDGAAVNNSMANKLGAIMDLEAPNHKFYFPHPVTNENIYVFPDPCHMIKNVRNALGTTYIKFVEKPFEDGKGQKISWKDIDNLNELQKKEGLRAANKITDRHIKYQENIMSVRLATQTLSNSVGDALKFLKETNTENFTSVEGTSEFCKHFNDIFDFLNCRTHYKLHTLQQPLRVPLTQENFEEMKKWADEKIHYIENLEDNCGKPLIHFSRKCGFQGLVICLQNVFRLYEDLQKKYGLEYLLTYKILQDMIENLFSVIRMMGGFRNNPTPYQFQTAIRRILIHHEVVYSNNSNCCLDEIKVLNISSSTQGSQGMEEDDADDDEDPDEMIELFNFQNITVPSNFVQHVVKYISGYIVYKLKILRSHSSCQECFDCVSAENGSVLTDIKNRGRLCYAAENIISLCTHLESIIRANGDNVLRPHFSKQVIEKIESEYLQYFNTSHFQDESNHGLTLARYITKLYLTIRLHHEESIRNQVTKYIRKIHSKLILFRHQ